MCDQLAILEYDGKKYLCKVEDVFKANWVKENGKAFELAVIKEIEGKRNAIGMRVCETNPGCPFTNECTDNINITTHADVKKGVQIIARGREGCMMDFLGDADILKKFGIELSHELFEKKGQKNWKQIGDEREYGIQTDFVETSEFQNVPKIHIIGED